jgi:hypothetical protein
LRFSAQDGGNDSLAYLSLLRGFYAVASTTSAIGSFFCCRSWQIQGRLYFRKTLQRRCDGNPGPVFEAFTANLLTRALQHRRVEVRWPLPLSFTRKDFAST